MSNYITRCLRRPRVDEEWQTMLAEVHAEMEVYVQALRLGHQLGLDSRLWCQDLADAYRAYPVREPSHAFMLLQTPTGPALCGTGRCLLAAQLLSGISGASSTPCAGWRGPCSSCVDDLGEAMTPARPNPGSSTSPSSANFWASGSSHQKARHPSTEQ